MTLRELTKKLTTDALVRNLHDLPRYEINDHVQIDQQGTLYHQETTATLHALQEAPRTLIHAITEPALNEKDSRALTDENHEQHLNATTKAQIRLAGNNALAQHALYTLSDNPSEDLRTIYNHATLNISQLKSNIPHTIAPLPSDHARRYTP